MSLKAIATSSSNTFFAGISPLMMRQKRQRSFAAMAADDTTIRYDYCPMSSEALMAIGAVLIASGVTTFGICIAMLVGANERPIVATLPLAEGQSVTLDAPGPYMLRGDSGGTLTFAFIGLRYSLQAPDGTQVVGYRPVTHGGVNGVPYGASTCLQPARTTSASGA